MELNGYPLCLYSIYDVGAGVVLFDLFSPTHHQWGLNPLMETTSGYPRLTQPLVQDAVAPASKTALEDHLFFAIAVKRRACRTPDRSIAGT